MSCFKKSVRNDQLYENNFNSLMYPLIIIAQLFALMPITNARKKGCDIKFKCISLIFIYYVLVCCGASFCCVITIIWFTKHKMQFGRLGKKIYIFENEINELFKLSNVVHYAYVNFLNYNITCTINNYLLNFQLIYHFMYST